MQRQAHLSASCNMEMGIFALLGKAEAHRAAGAWRPRTRLVMEEVSLAFHLVDQQRLLGEIVSRTNIERLAVTLQAYFASSGQPRALADIARMIDEFLADNSLPDADQISRVRRSIGVRLPLLFDLRLAEEEVAARFKGLHNRPASLGDVGLILDRELDDSRYLGCTPLNCRTFASTGGDGAHFSLLVQDDAITDSSPVVVTTPEASGHPSVVVAESLFDFLCLGAEKGYFGLGGWSLTPEQTLREYLGPEGELPVTDYLIDDGQYQVLGHLRDRLGIKRPKTGPDLDELETCYGRHLRYPPGAIF
ncbi:MAG: hypothetical protein WD872_05570 [Pirellulaceae bacterium]